MIVLIDIGNTRTKYCLVDQGKRRAQQAISNECLSNKFLTTNFSCVNKLIVASVSHNKLTDKMSAWCRSHKIEYQRVVSEAKKDQVITAYQVPSQLGVDRWLTLIGAAKQFPNKNILIVDAGTATTVDLLTSNGQHQGGWILAGIKTLITSILAETEQVQAKDKEIESVAFGTNTSENVHNAAWAATIGAVNLAISQAQLKGFVLDEVIFTGGNGMLLSSLISFPNTVIEDLVFSGLQAYI
ncbi:MAG: type III pantothenate kinase [Colwellia sp.]|nr:type III pantothenate kinase [Colwellia sp.]